MARLSHRGFILTSYRKALLLAVELLAKEGIHTEQFITSDMYPTETMNLDIICEEDKNSFIVKETTWKKPAQWTKKLNFN